MRFREFLIEGPVQDNQRALESYFDPESPDLPQVKKDYARWMNLFTQIIKPNINPAVAGQYMNFWSSWGRYMVGLLWFKSSMSEKGGGKFFKFFIEKHDLPLIEYEDHSQFWAGVEEDVQNFYNDTPYNSVKNWVPDHLLGLLEWVHALENMIEEEQPGQKQIIDHSNEDSKGIEPIDLPVELPNGMKWFNLNRNYCEREGKAMGHCGNEPYHDLDDTVLSLREPKGQNHWRPVVTFVLNTSTGLLGERKGRGNRKPTSEYHPAILALLRYYDPILGVQDEGHLPKEDFDIFKDVPNSNPLKQEILKLKPRMFGKNIKEASNYMSKDDFENYIKDLGQQAKQEFGDDAILDMEDLEFRKPRIVLDSAENDRELVKKITGDPDIINYWLEEFQNDKKYQSALSDISDTIRDRMPDELYEVGFDDLAKTLELLDREDSETVDPLYQDYFNMVYDQYIDNRVSDSLADTIMTARSKFDIKDSGDEPIQLYVEFSDWDGLSNLADNNGYRNYGEYYKKLIIPDIEKIFAMKLEDELVRGPDGRYLMQMAFTNDLENFEKFADEWIRKNVPSGSLMTDSVNRMKQLAGIQLCD